MWSKLRRGRPDRRARACCPPVNPWFLKLNGRIHPRIRRRRARPAGAFRPGRIHFAAGITAGIENTNYFLYTSRGEYVLTLFEVLTQRAQLPFYIELMHQLAERGIPVPQPQTLRDGTRLTTLHGKPCAIVTRLPGGYGTRARRSALRTGRRHAGPHPSGRPGLPDTPAQSARAVLVAETAPRSCPSWTKARPACCRRNWPNSRPPAPPRPGKAALGSCALRPVPR